MTGYKCSTTYSYEALGRQSSVSSGPTSSADLLTSQYGYTLQQWTSSLTTELDGRTVFSETLGYDSPSNSLGGPSYTGLITRKGETWSIPTGPSPSQVQPVSRTEDYVYDYAARLSGWDDTSNGENISYDARGNITSRSPRHGSGGTVTLTYTGDRLATRKVGTGAAVSFAHDSFARMTTDAEAGLSITYNALDLPETISSGNTLQAKYTYLSDGTKVSAFDASGAGLVYRGPFTYRRSSGGTLAFESAPFDSGRLTEAGARYHVTDHLGSVRAVIDGNASTTTYPLAGFYSVDDFAPFGVKSASSASSYLSLASTGSTVSLRDGFTGQEDQGPDFGVGYSDFGARQYSPTLSRWLVPDPMGEKYYDVSPYVYCAGNPISLVDIDGKALRIRHAIHNTVTNLAQIAATQRGGVIVSKLSERPTYLNNTTSTYDVVPTPSIFLASFNGSSIKYVFLPILPVGYGSPSELAFMGHEIAHAYDVINNTVPIPKRQSFDQRAITESNAVTFENYLRSVYGIPFLRKHYAGYESSYHFNPVTTRSNDERITDFKEISRSNNGRCFGYSYNTVINGVKSMNFIIAGVDDKNYFYFKLYESEEEFREATQDWQ